MRNRAKCGVCGDIIESISSRDYVSCRCGEIAVDGGAVEFKAYAKSWEHFLRIDDEGIVTKVLVEDEERHMKTSTRDELLQMLKDMIDKIEELPPHAMHSFCTHYDLLSFMMLSLALFKSERSPDS